MGKLAAVLRSELESKGWSVYRLAHESGVRLATVQRIVSGETTNPGILTVLALLAPLGRDLGWLHRKGCRP